MKIIIAGSRFWPPTSYEVQCALKDAGWLDKIEEVVCGMAPGGDTSGRKWAIESSIAVKDFPADWERLGKRAGPLRNRAMADYADAAIIFWDGSSSGSVNMCAQMNIARKPVRVYSRRQVEDLANAQ